MNGEEETQAGKTQKAGAEQEQAWGSAPEASHPGAQVSKRALLWPPESGVRRLLALLIGCDIT